MASLSRGGVLALVVSIVVVGCDDACLDEAPDLSCAPLYEPTFDNVYDVTIAQKCAVSGASCHGVAGNQGGLTLEGRDAAHAALSAETDAQCAPLVVRTHTSDAGTQMPPGAPLSEAELCAIRQWVAAGTPR